MMSSTPTPGMRTSAKPTPLSPSNWKRPMMFDSRTSMVSFENVRSPMSMVWPTSLSSREVSSRSTTIDSPSSKVSLALVIQRDRSRLIGWSRLIESVVTGSSRSMKSSSPTTSSMAPTRHAVSGLPSRACTGRSSGV